MIGENKMAINKEINQYQEEVQEKWGKTEAFSQYEKQTKNYTKEKWSNLEIEMDNILASFAKCMNNQDEPNSKKVQTLVKNLQEHITNNYYNCTNDILYNLGQMYIEDEKFKKNLDKHSDGTAMYINKAIKIYCNVL